MAPNWYTEKNMRPMYWTKLAYKGINGSFFVGSVKNIRSLQNMADFLTISIMISL
jgi:hypothetical protein